MEELASLLGWNPELPISLVDRYRECDPWCRSQREQQQLELQRCIATFCRIALTVLCEVMYASAVKISALKPRLEIHPIAQFAPACQCETSIRIPGFQDRVGYVRLCAIRGAMHALHWMTCGRMDPCMEVMEKDLQYMDADTLQRASRVMTRALSDVWNGSVATCKHRVTETRAN